VDRPTLKNDLEFAQMVFRRVYSDEAPQGGAAPLVVYAFLGGIDKQVTSRGRLSSVLYLIRAIADGSSYDTVEPIADRIEFWPCRTGGHRPRRAHHLVLSRAAAPAEGRAVRQADRVPRRVLPHSLSAGRPSER
jgi:hypothetical protein